LPKNAALQLFAGLKNGKCLNILSYQQKLSEHLEQFYTRSHLMKSSAASGINNQQAADGRLIFG